MTVYACLINGELHGVYDLLPKDWNGVINFDSKALFDKQMMRENGFVKIIRDTTAYNPETHKMSDWPTYSIQDGEVYEHRTIIPIDQPDPCPPNRNI